MKRTSILVALMVVVGMVAIPAVGAVTQENSETETDVDETSPGERLSGVVGVQQAEFDGEIERNAFTIALDRADDNATKASHITEKLNETEDRLAELDERKAELDEQRANDEITEGQYRAQAAKTATEVETQKQQLNQSNATASELPAETLEENGVNVTAIGTLMNNANELSGDEVSEIAQSIAGDRSGIVDRPGEDRNGSEDRGEQRQDDGDTDEASDADDRDDEQDQDPEQETEADTDEQQDETDDETDDDSGTGNGSDASSNGSSANGGTQ